MKIKVLALIACLAASVAEAQNSVDLSLDDARVLAVQAVQAGEFELAREVARKLLEVDPDDRDALLVLAVAEPQLGDADAGWEAGARAWRLSETEAARYEAARVTALAAANGERFTLSTLWLRIALNDAPNEAERTRTLQDARVVTRRNPWSTNLTFSVVPSNNVNSGTDDETDDGGGTFSRDAQALSGVRGTIGLRTQYRLNETQRSRTTVAVNLQSSRVALDDDGAVNTTRRVTVIDPDTCTDINDPTTCDVVTIEVPTSFVRNEDFATDYLELSLGHVQLLENGNVSVNLAVGSFDFGGEPYYDFKRVGLGRTIPLTDTLALQLFAQREIQDYESTGIVETRRTTLSTSLSYRLASGNRLTGTLSHLSSESPRGNFEFDEWSVRGSYSWAEPIGPISLSVNAGLKQSDYPDFSSFNVPEPGREDTTFLYGATVGFPDVSYAGFEPTINLSGSIADSNISRFTRDSFSVNFSLRSLF